MTDRPAAPTVLALRAGDLRLALRPDLGAAIAGLWHQDLPVLLSADPMSLATPRPSGGFVLAPYSNRLGGRHFHWQGQGHTTAPNTAGSAHSLHGMAWARPWAVHAATTDQATLQLDHLPDADWPFAFSLQQRVVLTPDALALHLDFTNTDHRTQPVGLGWHPFFPKRAGSHLQIALTDRWDPDPGTELPAHKRAMCGIDADVAQLSYDHCFEGWPGEALIRDEVFSLKLSAALPYLVVYTPPGKPLYCVEPVSHLSDAIHRPDPTAHGLCALDAGARLQASFRLDIARA